jgi:hypothetical protein
MPAATATTRELVPVGRASWEATKLAVGGANLLVGGVQILFKPPGAT